MNFAMFANVSKSVVGIEAAELASESVEAAMAPGFSLKLAEALMGPGVSDHLARMAAACAPEVTLSPASTERFAKIAAEWAPKANLSGEVHESLWRLSVATQPVKETEAGTSDAVNNTILTGFVILIAVAAIQGAEDSAESVATVVYLVASLVGHFNGERFGNGLLSMLTLALACLALVPHGTDE